MTKPLLTLAAACALTFSASSFAATAVNSGGFLVGINDISITGYGTYNVSFGNFDASSVYTDAFATVATTSLYDSLNDNITDPLFGFDALGNLRITGADGFSYISTVFDFTAPFSFSSRYIEAFDGFDLASILDDNDTYTGAGENEVFATWTEATVVPVPAAAFLFAPALFGFLAIRRNRR